MHVQTHLSLGDARSIVAVAAEARGMTVLEHAAVARNQSRHGRRQQAELTDNKIRVRTDTIAE